MNQNWLSGQSKQRLIISWFLVLIWMTIIFLFSAQSGEDSGELSGGLLERIAALMTWLRLDILLSRLPFNFHLLIRKTAHFMEYMILGILVSNALRKAAAPRIPIIKSQLICTFYAISDEVHQLFIPGRAGQVKDVLIDSFGACTGILLMLWFMILITKKQNMTNFNRYKKKI